MFEKSAQPEVTERKPFVFQSDTGVIKQELNKGNLHGQNFYDKCCLTVNIFTNQLKQQNKANHKKLKSQRNLNISSREPSQESKTKPKIKAKRQSLAPPVQAQNVNLLTTTGFVSVTDGDTSLPTMTPAGVKSVTTQDQDILKRRKYSEMGANSIRHFKKEPVVLTPENGRSPRRDTV